MILKEEVEEFPNTPIKLKDKLFEEIEGHQLGDGCVNKSKTHVNYHFSLSSKYLNYVEDVAEKLEILGPSLGEKKNKETGKVCYYLSTRLLISPEYHDRWYKDGKKIIPNDLILTPTVCKNWYIDDGGFTGGWGQMRLSTQSFTKQNMEKTVLPQLRQVLCDENEEIKIKEYKSEKYKPVIIIPKKFTKRFLEYIGKCPIKEFEYKWDIKPYKQKNCEYI